MSANPEDSRKRLEEASSVNLIEALLSHRLHFFNEYSFFSIEFQKEAVEEVVTLLRKYYAILGKDGNFEPVLNALQLQSKMFELQRREEHFYQLCAMIYYADKQLNRASGASLSEKLINKNMVTQVQVEKQLKQIQTEDTLSALPPPSSLSDSGESSSGFNGNEGEGHRIIEPKKQLIDYMPPKGELAAAFFMWAIGVLQLIGSLILVILLAGSVIPSFGLSTPLAIAAGFCFVSGVVSMGAGIKLGMNAFSFLGSSSVAKDTQRDDQNSFGFSSI